MSMIECTSFYGQKRLIPKEKFILRPAAYAVIINDKKILLVNTRGIEKYHLPGGGIDAGEKIEDALKREVREETGIEIDIERFASFKEDFFYYDQLDKAYHCFRFFYICRPKTFDLLDDDQVNDRESEKPRWIEIHELRQDDFLCHGETIIDILRRA